MSSAGTNEFSTPSVNVDCRVPKRRSPSGASITNAYSAKRRRISLASIDLSREMQSRIGSEIEVDTETSVADRFIPSRPKTSLPLYTTPRTNRIARVFGLADDRILNFPDAPSSSADLKVVRLLRKSASQLFDIPPLTPITSAATNLGSNKQFIMALDGPGVPLDTFASPLTWSLNNHIAVACGTAVYYQNLDTRSISQLPQLSGPHHGVLHSIKWAGSRRPDTLTLGTTHGTVQIWDAASGKQLTNWPDIKWLSVGGMDWQDDVLAVGRGGGKISMFDARVKRMIKEIPGHKGTVHGVRWSQDGSYMASGDQHGSVFIWDSRASKTLTDGGKRGSRMKHEGPVKALAWCPWKSDLLATGSQSPEGTIRVWSATSSSSPPMPLQVLPLKTSITSLHWSPHCKELLSTHGSSWASSLSGGLPTRLQPVSGSLAHTITVFSYPTCKRIISVVAHAGTIGHSCLGPDGSKVFTVCAAEEAMKMWRVWGIRQDVEKRDSVFDKCTIR